MHPRPKILLKAAFLMVASVSIAQEPYHAPDPDVMARLSYDDSGVVIRPGNVHHVCIAVSRDGEYRIVRSTGLGPTERRHGTMPKEEFNQLSELLRAPEFRNLSGYHGGIVRQEAQTFGVEIPLRDRAQVDRSQQWPETAWHLQWMNGDGRNPFPASISRVVDWIRRFQPKDGKTFEYTDYPDVCPNGGLRLLQPFVAENSHP